MTTKMDKLVAQHGKVETFDPKVTPLRPATTFKIEAINAASVTQPKPSEYLIKGVIEPGQGRGRVGGGLRGEGRSVQADAQVEGHVPGEAQRAGVEDDGPAPRDRGEQGVGVGREGDGAEPSPVEVERFERGDVADGLEQVEAQDGVPAQERADHRFERGRLLRLVDRARVAREGGPHGHGAERERGRGALAHVRLRDGEGAVEAGPRLPEWGHEEARRTACVSSCERHERRCVVYQHSQRSDASSASRRASSMSDRMRADVPLIASRFACAVASFSPRMAVP